MHHIQKHTVNEKLKFKVCIDFKSKENKDKIFL